MQYILSQEEMDHFNDCKRRIGVVDKLIGADLKGLMTLCRKVADHAPVEGGWYDGKTWGCLHSSGKEWYCDECPAKEQCPSVKRWSK